MTKRRDSFKLYPIRGPVEAVVADMMANEGVVTRVDARDVPALERFDNDGTVCHCALVMNGALLAEFNMRVAVVRASRTEQNG